MRLNFSGSDADEIREGIRRIGAVVGEQVELYETITAEHRVVTAPEPSEPADVVPLRRPHRKS
jgi:2-aminoadipate transaminase